MGSEAGLSLGLMDNCHVAGTPESMCPTLPARPLVLGGVSSLISVQGYPGLCRSKADIPTWLSYLIDNLVVLLVVGG